MDKTVIHTSLAPEAIGTYSQAVKVDQTVYLSGQIPLVPETMNRVGEDIGEQIEQVLKNLKSVAQAAGGELSDIVKLNIYLTRVYILEYFHSKSILTFQGTQGGVFRT